MRFPIIAIMAFFFFANCDRPSDKRITYNDSLRFYTERAKQFKSDHQLRLRFVRKAESFLGNINDTTTRNSLYRISKEYSALKNRPDFNRTVKRLLKQATRAKDSLLIAKSYNLLGNDEINSNQNDSAYFYLLKSEKLFSRLGDSLDLGQNYIDKSFVQLYEGDYSGCELSSIQSLTYLKQFGLWQKQYDAYNLIGICSNELKNFENAIIYHQKALQLVRDHNLYSKLHLQANSLNNLGVVNQNQNNHAKAIENFEEALVEKNLLLESPSLFAMITDNLGYSEFKERNFSHLPDLFMQSLTIREKNELFSSVIVNKVHLSEFYYAVNDSIKAKLYAQGALKLSNDTKSPTDLLLALKQLSVVDHNNSSKYSKEYIRISDSLQQIDRIRKDKFARIQFETDEILSENDRLTEQNRSLLYFFVGTLLIGLLLFVIRLQRAKNRELLLIQAQQKVNEDIYNLMISQQQIIEENRVKEKKRIAQELHDGVLGRLFGARLNLDSLNKSVSKTDIDKRFSYLDELKNIEQDIREISHDLNREKSALINNFEAIVTNLLVEQRESHSSKVLFTIDDIKWEKVNNTIKINLYRILQESLQNINKYANAKSIQVAFSLEGQFINLMISDDGLGFDTNTKKKGIGLQNMLSRINECGGEIEILSEKNRGTTIKAKVLLI